MAAGAGAGPTLEVLDRARTRLHGETGGATVDIQAMTEQIAIIGAWRYRARHGVGHVNTPVGKGAS